MKYLPVFIAFCLIPSLIRAQDQRDTQPQNDSERFMNFNFGGKFAARLVDYPIPDCYITNFEKFKDNFEAVYFMEQSFSVREIVNMGYQPGQKRVIFKSFTQYSENNILNKLNELFAAVKKVSEQWSAREKDIWLLKHDKYSKPVQK
jgi:hypothetical protein